MQFGKVVLTTVSFFIMIIIFPFQILLLLLCGGLVVGACGITIQIAPTIMTSGRGGLVYVGHLPHGFYEKEITGYFSQFGTVTKVKVARNKKVLKFHLHLQSNYTFSFDLQNGRCKGFAFVEFECDEVAKIVAQTMNNYMMFNKLLKCWCGLTRVSC